MLHYLVEPHDDPVTWRDVEALPLIGFAVLILIGVMRVYQELPPALSADFLKAAGIVVLLGIRRLIASDDDDVAEIATA